MRPTTPLAALALVTALGCTDRDRPPGTEPTIPSAAFVGSPTPLMPTADLARLEALARRMAIALRDSAFRADLKRQLDGSTLVEHKLHFQRLLARDRGAVQNAVARLNGEPSGALGSAAAAAIPLELYFPVPAHRAAWTGGPDLLVATAVKDGDAPIAFDTAGRRLVLDAKVPPPTPVLAIEPVETNFDAAGPMVRPNQTCQPPVCGGGGGGAAAPLAGLYMTASHLNSTFEGWLKGSPEIEILVLGQKGASDSLTGYQCIGERVAPPYNFNQDNKDWSGSVLLYSQAQLDAYKAGHPGQALRLFYMEDDDTSCELRQNGSSIQRLIGTVDAAVRGLSGGRDSTLSPVQRLYKFLAAIQKVWSVTASFINSNDDMIGNAVDDVVAGEVYPGYNWVLRGENNVTNGYVNLQMR